jgi:uracil-DNA glycosylase family 4
MLYRTGFANQPTSTHRNDGLELKNCYVAAGVRCCPPENKPTRQEQDNCRPYLVQELRLLRNLRAVLVLGRIAFTTYLDALEDCGLIELRRGLEFAHGAAYDLPVPGPGRDLHRAVRLFASYHPSQRNTQTGLLTPAMFLRVLRAIRRTLSGQVASAARAAGRGGAIP